MIAATELSAALHELPARTRANLAVELIDSLDDGTWRQEALANLADDRDADMENGAINALSYEKFISGLIPFSMNNVTV